MQALMARAVSRPLNASEEMQSTWEDGSRTAHVVGGFVKPNDRLSAFERLQIYNQQYWWRLQGAFAEDFRGLRAVLGERRFEKLANAYLHQCGSTSWSLRDLGSKLEGFLLQYPELTAPDEVLALDMVQVEWARVIAFDGPELHSIQPAELQNVPASVLRLGLQPYLTLLTLQHPIDELLGKLKRQATSETGVASNAVSSERPRARRRLRSTPSAEPIYLAVHRVDLSVYYKRLAAPAHRLLSALAAGTVLEVACDEAFSETAEPPDTAAAQLQAWFSDWMKFGWFTQPAA